MTTPRRRNGNFTQRFSTRLTGNVPVSQHQTTETLYNNKRVFDTEMSRETPRLTSEPQESRTVQARTLRHSPSVGDTSSTVTEPEHRGGEIKCVRGGNPLRPAPRGLLAAAPEDPKSAVESQPRRSNISQAGGAFKHRAIEEEMGAPCTVSDSESYF